MPNNNSFILLSGTANLKLALDIGRLLNSKVHTPITKFADGETRVRIPVNLRRKEVFIIQSTCPPNVDSYYIELILMIDAARRASARRVIAVMPYMGYSRQDRKEGPRVPISAALMLSVIEHSGANAICALDIHSEPQQGFIKSPLDNLFGSYSLIPKLKSLHLGNLVVASPDKGGVPRATAYATFLKAEGVAIVYKERDVNLDSNADNTKAMDLIGDVSGKNVLLVDDMIDTAGTLVNAAQLIYSKGAKSIVAAATHGLFSSPAIERIEKSEIKEIFVTDSIPPSKEVLTCKKIKYVTVAPLLAKAIERIYSGESVSSLIL